MTRVFINEDFLDNSENIFPNILPDFSHLSDVITVIDVTSAAIGQVVQVYMNADSEEALAILGPASDEEEVEFTVKEPFTLIKKADVHWQWRKRNIEGLAARLDTKRFGVKAFYIFGSTKNGTAGPGSDIDVLIHFTGSEEQRSDLNMWLEGWSQSFSQMNFLRTGVKTDGLLDVHIVTDEDIKKGSSYASKIGAVTDAARPLALGTEIKKK